MEISDPLARDLLEAHRPILDIDRVMSPPGVTQWLVHCDACQNSQRTIWRSGDPKIHCKVWAQALEENLVEDSFFGE